MKPTGTRSWLTLVLFATVFLVAAGPSGCGPKDPNRPRAEAPSTPSQATEPVTIQWDASKSVVVGYHVHRSEKPGGPYKKLTASPVKETSYTDATAVRGKTYYYVVTSIDAYGIESGYSNEIVVKVP